MIRAATLTLTWILFSSVIGIALLFVLAYRGIGFQDLMVDYGLWMVFGVCLLLIITMLMRLRAGHMMLSRNQLAEAIAYCQPRSSPSLTVGRNEAAANRYSAAEAHRRRGAPSAALALLDTEDAQPRNTTLVQLLRLVRASSMIDMGRVEEGKKIIDSVASEASSREAKQAIKDAKALLDAKK